MACTELDARLEVRASSVAKLRWAEAARVVGVSLGEWLRRAAEDALVVQRVEAEELEQRRYAA